MTNTNHELEKDVKTTMESEEMDDDIFDLSKLRLSQNFPDIVGVIKAIITGL